MKVLTTTNINDVITIEQVNNLLIAKREQLRASHRKFGMNFTKERLHSFLELGTTVTGFKYYKSYKSCESLFPNVIREEWKLACDDAKKECNAEFLKYNTYLHKLLAHNTNE